MQKKIKEKRIFPFPEALKNGDSWKIQDSKGGPGPFVSVQTKDMNVPLDDDRSSALQRAHEMGHIQFSPKSLNAEAQRIGVHPSILNSVEDARVNYILKAAKIDAMQATATPNPEEEKRYIKDLLSKDDFLCDVVLSALSSAYTGSAKIVADTANEACTGLQAQALSADLAVAKAAIKKLGDMSEMYQVANKAHSVLLGNKKSLPKFARTRKAALYIAQYLKDKDNAEKAKKEAEEAEKKRKQEEAKRKKQMNQLRAEEIEKRNRAKNLEELRKQSKENGEVQLRLKDGSTIWKPMRILKPRTSVSFAPRLLGRKKRPTDMGMIPRYMNRYCIDKNVFAVRKKAPGATILVDGSGSMRWSVEMLQELIDLLPAMKLAIYGDGASGGDLYGGCELRVLVDRRRRVPDSDIYSYGGNGCDGLALRWLGKQKGPRYWISDGGVSGSGGQTYNLLLDVAQVCQQYKIVQLYHMQEALEYFKVRFSE